MAFADSDARPRPEWLRSLISHLDRPEVGAATGYRWFVPARASLANQLLYSINCGIGLLLGNGGRHLVWGGSWAISHEQFQSLRVRQMWNGVVSDDLSISRLLWKRGLKILFQPPCMVASPLEQSPGGMFGFLRRQYVLVRMHMPRLWALAVLGGTLFNAALLGSMVLLGWGLLHREANSWVPALILGLLYGLTALRNWTRQDLGRRYFPALEAPLAAARRFDIWAGPLAGLVNWVGLLASAVGREITWRGIRYQLSADGRIIRVHRLTPAEEPAAPQRKAA